MHDTRTLTCHCPQCGVAGRSVAALHYAETQTWQSAGDVSLSGVAVGTGGLSVVAGTGSTQSQGTSTTKRAAVFAEPQQRHSSPQAAVGGMLLVMLVVVAVGALSDGGGDGPFGAMSEQLGFWIRAVACVAGFGVMATIAWRYTSGLATEDQHNREVHPRQLDRYQQLLLCEACNVLFDGAGQHQPANAAGFASMMRGQAAA